MFTRLYITTDFLSSYKTSLLIKTTLKKPHHVLNINIGVLKYHKEGQCSESAEC